MIPVNRPLIHSADINLVSDQLSDGWVSSESKIVRAFEDRFAALHNTTYALAVSNGTAAIDVAVALLGIGTDDEVIISTFTIISCVSEVLKRGATPVFLDCESDFNVKAESVISAVTAKTKAVIIPHIYGLGSDIENIYNFCKSRGIVVIEDNAQAIGQVVAGSVVGKFCDISVYSFYPNKHITTGEGGMLCTQSSDFYERAVFFHNLCFNQTSRFVHEELGWNYRMTAMQAALGYSQLDKLNEHVEHKVGLAELYNQGLQGDKLILPDQKNQVSDNWYWAYPVLCKDATELARLKEVLSNHNIGSRPMFYPLHLQPVLKSHNFSGDQNPSRALDIYERGLYLPIGAGIKRTEVSTVISVIQDYYYD